MIISPYKLLYKFLILLLFCFHPLIAEETMEFFDFFKLEEIAKKERQNPNQINANPYIQIRGFLYETQDSHLILAAEPNLKSCCVGNSSKRDKQLLVTGNISKNNTQATPVTLQGHLVIDNQQAFPFRIENAQIIAETNHSYTTLIGVTSVLVLICALFVFKYKKKNS